MKSCTFLLLNLVLLGGCASTSVNSPMGSLTINYSTTGIKDGYDHISKLIIYENGNKIGESVPRKESDGNSLTISLANGVHKIRAVLNSEYDGKWEEHLKANDYSLDCLFEQSVEINGNKVITLIFDIELQQTIIK